MSSVTKTDCHILQDSATPINQNSVPHCTDTVYSTAHCTLLSVRIPLRVQSSVLCCAELCNATSFARRLWDRMIDGIEWSGIEPQSINCACVNPQGSTPSCLPAGRPAGRTRTPLPSRALSQSGIDFRVNSIALQCHCVAFHPIRSHSIPFHSIRDETRSHALRREVSAVHNRTAEAHAHRRRTQWPHLIAHSASHPVPSHPIT